MNYEERFKKIPTDQKRRDLLVHPMVDKESIENATDDDVEKVYLLLFSNMDLAMQDVIGESMFDDEIDDQRHWE